ncbi:DUF3822 family protein [Parabacteroides sp.]|uniref:DUF3822 family protein n=1 Tax=Parabacteroides sp. TaxID=1869337 RepID=UPI00033BD342|nr:DUF3822 family protein [Parabacteroides sp.]MDR3731477.1 DUF3822 family protein [Parabacteroides sp.]CDD51804.1 putative uncharacterized protein [Bacteroides sp. CAG:875]
MVQPIDFNKSEQYILSIRLSTDGFSFSIYHPQRNEEVYFSSSPVNTQRSMAANVKAYLTETEELKHKFKQVNILIHTTRYTSIPLELYEDEQTELLFYQNLPSQSNEVILCNILGKSNVVILFGLDKLTHLFLTEHFPDARLFASVSPLTEYFSRKCKLDNTRKLFAVCHPESIEVIGFEKEKLFILNSYSVSGINDSCYYLLNIWQQAGFNQEEDKLYLVGTHRIPQGDYLSQLLKKYIRKLYIINPQMEFNNTEISRIQQIPFDMLSLISCE